MPLIRITRAHSLSHARAREAADRIARDLRERFDLDYDWNGDEVTFERSGVSGRMHVGRQEVSLEVKLGLLLTPIAPAVEREINAQLDALFSAAAKSAAPARAVVNPKAPATKPVAPRPVAPRPQAPRPQAKADAAKRPATSAALAAAPLARPAAVRQAPAKPSAAKPSATQAPAAKSPGGTRRGKA